MGVKELKSRGGKLFALKEDLDSLWQTLADNFYPERATFTTTRAWGEEFASHLFDGSPVTMRRDLGNAFSSMLRPRGQQWFKITLSDDEVPEGGEIADWLENANTIMHRTLYNRRSQFVRATKTGDHDFATFGNAVISCDVNSAEDGLLFRCWHLKDCVWVENEDGVVDGLWRKMSLSARQMHAMFGDRIHDDVRRCLDKEPDKQFNVQHCMVPSDEYEYSAKPKAEFPYASVYIDCDHDSILREAGSHEFRYIVPRWQMISGSPYGTSPAAMTALADGRMIQSMARTMIEAAEKTVDPPMKATSEAIQGEVNLYAQGITWVDREYDEKLGPALEPIHLGKDVGLGVDMLERTRAMLADAWYISKLTLPQQQAKTAYETAQLVEEYVRQAIPIFEPMETEYNTPLLELAASILLRKGSFGKIPTDLQGRDLEFEFSNPLQEAIERNKVHQFRAVSEIAAIAGELDPGAPANLDANKATRDAIMGSGAPSDWLADEKEVEASAEQARTMQMAGAAANIAQPAADAVAKLSGAQNRAA